MYNQSYQTQQLIESITAMMMIAMGVGMMKPIIFPQTQKKRYYAALEHPDPLIHNLLKREDIRIYDYTAAYSAEQARRFFNIRYPSYRILYITDLGIIPKQAELLQVTVEYAPVNPLYAAEEWAALSPEKRMAIEREASLAGEKPYTYWLKMSSIHGDWVSLRKYYDRVREITEMRKAGKREYVPYPPFPTIKKALVKMAPSGYPVDVEECAKRHSRENLRSLAKRAHIKVTGSNKDICFKLMQSGMLLQEGEIR